jgi:hypothetical protein
MTDQKILVITIDPQLGIENLLDLACSENYNAGRKEENYWIVSTSAQFMHDGTEPVVQFNQLMFNAHRTGYNYIQITK